VPEALPTRSCRVCISIPLSANGEEVEIPGALNWLSCSVTLRRKELEYPAAYRVAQGMQSLLGEIREQIKAQTDEALKMEERVTGIRPTAHG